MMADGMLSAADVATGALLSGNRGYGGGGAWGGGVYGAPFAGPASNAVRANRNAGVIRDTAACTDAKIGAGLDRVSAQAEEGRRSSQFTAIKDAITAAEFRSGDRLRDLQAQITQNAKDAAECCCDAKVRDCENTAKILKAIADQSADTISRELDKANAKITQLEIFARCCPPA